MVERGACTALEMCVLPLTAGYRAGKPKAAFVAWRLAPGRSTSVLCMSVPRDRHRMRADRMALPPIGPWKSGATNTSQKHPWRHTTASHSEQSIGLPQQQSRRIRRQASTLSRDKIRSGAR